METHDEFLEFNGKVILFTSINGETFIAIKPVCEALGINYKAQYNKLKTDEFYRPAWSLRTMQVPNSQTRKMICITEKYFYGWLCGINSEKPDFVEYKRTCFEILYNHFNGTITKRSQILKEQVTDEAERQALIEKLKTSEEYLRLKEIEGNKKFRDKSLKGLDVELLRKSQTTLSFS